MKKIKLLTILIPLISYHITAQDTINFPTDPFGGTYDTDGVHQVATTNFGNVTFKITDDGLGTSFGSLTGISGSLNRGFRFGQYIYAPGTKGIGYMSNAGDGLHGEWFVFATDNGAEFLLSKFNLFESLAVFDNIEVVGFRDGVQVAVEEISITMGTNNIGLMVNNIGFQNVDEIRIRQKADGFYNAANPSNDGLILDSIMINDPIVPCSETTSALNVSSCTSYTVPSGDETYTSSQVVNDTIPNAGGCDSVMTINITITPALVASAVLDSNVSCNSFANGGATASATGGTVPYTYLWNNTATTPTIVGVTAGTFTVTVTDANGCTSNDNVTITQPAAVVASAVLDSNVSCNSFANGGATASATGGTVPYTYLWNNTATTPTIVGVTAGTFTVTVTDANGCTSNDNVTITQPAAIVATDIQTACDSYYWIDGNTYTLSNNSATFNIVGGAANGCDSLVTLDLTINSSYSDTTTMTSCDTYTWSQTGMTYTTSGFYYDSLTTVSTGCDSVLVLDLTINTVDVSTSQTGVNLSANATGATYQWIDCINGNAPISGETNQIYTATANGVYAVIITKNNCTDTSACIDLNTLGVNELEELIGVKIYPNPSQGDVFIQFDEFKNETYTLEIYNALGKKVFTQQITNTTTQITTDNFERGLYFINLYNANITKVYRLVLQ